METHPSILAWRTPWTEEPDCLQSMRLKRVRQDRATTEQQKQEPFRYFISHKIDTSPLTALFFMPLINSMAHLWSLSNFTT